MILRIILFGALAIGGLVFVKQDRVLARIGVISSCVPSHPASNAKGPERSAQWWSCDEGLGWFPTLDLQACASAGFVGRRELCYCSRPISRPQ